MKQYILGIALALSSVGAYAKENLDVLVLYSDEVREIYGYTGVKSRVNALVDYANDVFENSDTGIYLNLVRSAEVAIDGDTETSLKTLEKVRSDRWVAVHRKAVKPDLTVYLTSSSGPIAGTAYEPTPSQQHASYGLSLVRHDQISTFAHEIGHNLGAGHGQLGENAFDFGVPISTAMGYGQKDIFRTTMAYPLYYGTAPRIQYFSNPKLNECAGSFKCGSTSADSVGGITQNFNDFVKNYSGYWDVTDSGSKYCKFNDSSSGVPQGCTQSYIAGGPGVTVYRIAKNGNTLMHVEKRGYGYSCEISGNSLDYWVSGGCDNYSVYKK